MHSWDESILGRRNSLCKGPGVGMGLGVQGRAKRPGWLEWSEPEGGIRSEVRVRPGANHPTF